MRSGATQVPAAISSAVRPSSADPLLQRVSRMDGWHPGRARRIDVREVDGSRPQLFAGDGYRPLPCSAPDWGDYPHPGFPAGRERGTNAFLAEGGRAGVGAPPRRRRMVPDLMAARKLPAWADYGRSRFWISGSPSSSPGWSSCSSARARSRRWRPWSTAPSAMARQSATRSLRHQPDLHRARRGGRLPCRAVQHRRRGAGLSGWALAWAGRPYLGWLPGISSIPLAVLAAALFGVEFGGLIPGDAGQCGSHVGITHDHAQLRRLGPDDLSSWSTC